MAQTTAIIYTLRIRDHVDEETIKTAIFEGHLVGWEANKLGKMTPTVAKLSNVIDPTK